MDWDIAPLVGAGPITFGSSAETVAKWNGEIGEVQRAITDRQGNVTEFRSIHTPNLTYKDGKLVFIGISSRVKNVQIEGVKIFESKAKDVILHLQRLNQKDPNIGLGLVAFDNLCLYTSGFYMEKQSTFFLLSSGEQDDRSISLFSKEMYENSVSPYGSQLQSYHFRSS